MGTSEPSTEDGLIEVVGLTTYQLVSKLGKLFNVGVISNINRTVEKMPISIKKFPFHVTRKYTKTVYFFIIMNISK